MAKFRWIGRSASLEVKLSGRWLCVRVRLCCIILSLLESSVIPLSVRHYRRFEKFKLFFPSGIFTREQKKLGRSTHTCQKGYYQEDRDPKRWRGCGGKRTLVRGGRECKLVRPLQRTGRRFPQKLRTELPHDPAIPLLGVHPKKMKTVTQKDNLHPHVQGSTV